MPVVTGFGRVETSTWITASTPKVDKAVLERGITFELGTASAPGEDVSKRYGALACLRLEYPALITPAVSGCGASSDAAARRY
jgi:hypothetical protein